MNRFRKKSSLRTKNTLRYFSRVLIPLFVMALVLLGFEKDKPRILIIGDSISIGYTPFVKENLKDVAEVYHNPGNAQHTGTGLQKIEEWIGNGDWDIIQFNWGLWDLCYRHPDSKLYGNRDKIKGKITYKSETYATNLDAIVNRLKKITQARLIFVTTTFVPEDEAGRYQKDAIKYNRVAKEVMKNNKVLINDIYATSKTIHKSLGKGDDDVHYTDKGYKKLAVPIASFLKNELTKMAE